ncbi:MAG: cyclic nucleotide-binding domain-containing protein, partial [Myxococcota bacterium]
MPLEIRQAATDAERDAIFRLRYEIYVVDQRLFVEQADHERKLLSDVDDPGARLFYAEADGVVVGTMRLSWG